VFSMKQGRRKGGRRGVHVRLVSNLIYSMNPDPDIAVVPENNPEVAINHRGPYQRISVIDRQRIVDAFEKNRDWLSVAETKRPQYNRQVSPYRTCEC